MSDDKSKDYYKGRADAAEGRNHSPDPDWYDFFVGYDRDEMAKRREEYREGHADKQREMRGK